MAFLPDESRACVSLRDEDAVAAIDTASQKVVATCAVGPTVTFRPAAIRPPGGVATRQTN